MTAHQATTPITFIEIPEAPGYDAGSDGHIYSRRVQFYGGLSDARRQLKEKVDRYGYRCVSLWIDGRKRSASVHRLILSAFNGPCPSGMMACHFPDPDRSNNRPENLMWGTNSTNQLHRRDQGTAAIGTKNHRAILDETTAAEIRRLYAAGEGTQITLARRFGVSQRTIGRVVHGETWGEVGPRRNYQDRCGPKRGRKPRGARPAR